MQSLKRIILCCLMGLCALTAAGESNSHRFSVRDSIAMSTFSDPYTRSPQNRCQLSPDGRYFLFVTTQGVIDTNQLVSRLWLLDAKEVRQFVDGARASAPAPRLLFTAHEVPRSLQSNSYASLITQAQWSSDSTSIFFLRDQKTGTRRLFRISIKGLPARAITGPNENIESYVEIRSSIFYTAENQTDQPAAPVDRRIGSGGAERLTGLSLTAILHPEELVHPDSVSIPRDLWLLQKGQQPRRLNSNRGASEWHPPSALSGRFQPALSPDGKTVIAAIPAASLPKAWLSLRFATSVYTFDKLKIDKDPTGTIWSWPWQYASIDLKTGEAKPLVDAPSAMQAGTYDSFIVDWSPDGKRVLFTNSFLPSDKMQDEKPCAVAVYTVADHLTECLRESRFPKENSHLVTAGFGQSSQEVVVNWSADGRLEEEHLRLHNGWWVRETAEPEETSSRGGFAVVVKQDLDVRPTLWVKDEVTGKEKFLWDPNPQLTQVRIGSASVYRWKDATGYQWTAGLVHPPDYVTGRRYPLVIQTHGFFSPHEFLADGSFTTGFAAQPLASAGFVVIQMGDRSDRHVRPASEEADLMAEAFRDLIASLDQEGIIDPRRVGIIGFSRSSWYVENALVKFPQLFRAATIIDGVDESYMTYLMFCPEYRLCQVDKEAINGGPPFGQNLARWLSKAPGFQLNKIQAAVRIEAIRPMSILEEWELYASLRLQNKTVDFVYIPDGQHILQKPWERLASQQGNVDWFSKWLLQ